MSRGWIAVACMALCCAFELPAQAHDSSTSTANAARELTALNARVEEAVVRGDAAFLEEVLATDFRFPHGDEWTSGGEPSLVDSKSSWIAAVKNRRTAYIARDVSAQQVELHGDVALVTGKIHVRTTSDDTKWRDYTIWFLRTFVKRHDRWQLISHRTVHETFAQ